MLPKLVKFVFCLALTFATIASLHAADAPKKRDINLDDLPSFSASVRPSSLPMASGLSTPSARSTPRKTKSQSHLWMVKWDGSVHLQLTYGKEGASAPKFSPDGRYISFLSSRPGTVQGRPGLGDGSSRRRSRAAHEHHRPEHPGL